MKSLVLLVLLLMSSYVFSQVFEEITINFSEYSSGDQEVYPGILTHIIDCSEERYVRTCNENNFQGRGSYGLIERSMQVFLIS